MLRLPHLSPDWLRLRLSGRIDALEADVDAFSPDALLSAVGAAEEAATDARSYADLLALGDIEQAYRQRTKAELNALAPPDGTPALVYTDESRNGERNVIYLREAGAWIYQGSLDGVSQQTFEGHAPFINLNNYLVTATGSNAVHELRSKLADDELDTVVISGRGGATYTPGGDVRIPAHKRLIIEPGVTYRPTHSFAEGLHGQPETGVKAGTVNARDAVVAFLIDGTAVVENYGTLDLDGLSGGGRRTGFFLRGAHGADVRMGKIIGGSEGLAAIDSDGAYIHDADDQATLWPGNATVSIENCDGLHVARIRSKGREEGIDANTGANRCHFVSIMGVELAQGVLELNNSVGCTALGVSSVDTPSAVIVFDYTDAQAVGIYSSRGLRYNSGGHSIEASARYTAASNGMQAIGASLEMPGPIRLDLDVRLEGCGLDAVKHALYVLGDHYTGGVRPPFQSQSEFNVLVVADAACVEGCIRNPPILVTEHSSFTMRPEVHVPLKAGQSAVRIGGTPDSGLDGSAVVENPVVINTGVEGQGTGVQIEGSYPALHSILGQGLYSGLATDETTGANIVRLRRSLEGSRPYDWPAIPPGEQATVQVTVTGAQLGDYVESVAMDVSLQGGVLSGSMSGASAVTVVLRNDTGAVLNLASGILNVIVRPKS